jgi:hypothetical protein
MSDRKYRQQGYRGGAGGGPSDPDHRGAPRPGGTFGILRSRPTSRCAECGSVLPITADSLTHCPHCRSGLHACRQCAHFDPARRFECTQGIEERIADKKAVNGCPLFSLMVTVERDTSAGTTRPVNAHRSFDDLFKH